MNTLAITDGDLVLAGGRYLLAAGSDKVAQDVRMALGEPLGNDRFHPGWGSRLFDFTGMPLDSTARFGVEQEVNRVIANYVAVQRDKIQTDTLGASRSRYQTSEVIAQVAGVKVTANIDTIRVTIYIGTVDGQQVTLTSTVGG